MSGEMIRYERRGAVALVTFDRQERRNAWDAPMYRAVVAGVERANADPEIGAIVLTNDGPVFCAGTDFKASPEPRDPATGKRPTMASLSMAEDTSWVHLLARSKPVIAAVNGAAIGLGVTQILPADIRVCSTSSTFSLPFLKIGFMPELGSTALLPRVVGFGRAVDLCLRAAKLDAAEAERIGLVTQVYADSSFLDDVLTLAESLAGYDRTCVTLTKSLFRENALEQDPNAYLAREREAFVTLYRARKSASGEKRS